MVRNHYPELLPGNPKVAALRAKTRELCEFLHDVLQVRPRGRFDARVGLHQSCHACASCGWEAAARGLVPPYSKTRALLEGIEGLKLAELSRADECCGFGAPSPSARRRSPAPWDATAWPTTSGRAPR